MSAGDYIALALAALSVGGIGVRLIISMTRLVDAVERLTNISTSVTSQIEDHERRLGQLEARA